MNSFIHLFTDAGSGPVVGMGVTAVDKTDKDYSHNA